MSLIDDDGPARNGCSAAKAAREQYAQALGPSQDLMDLGGTHNHSQDKVVSRSSPTALPFGLGSTVAARYEGGRECYLARVTWIYDCKTRVDIEWLRPAGGAIADRRYLCTTNQDETNHNRGLSIKDYIRSPNKNGTSSTPNGSSCRTQKEADIPDLLDMKASDKASAANGVLDLLGESAYASKENVVAPSTLGAQQNGYQTSPQIYMQQPTYSWGVATNGAQQPQLGHALHWNQNSMSPKRVSGNVQNGSPFPGVSAVSKPTLPSKVDSTAQLQSQLTDFNLTPKVDSMAQLQSQLTDFNLTPKAVKQSPQASKACEKNAGFNFVSDMLAEAGKTAN